MHAGRRVAPLPPRPRPAAPATARHGCRVERLPLFPPPHIMQASRNEPSDSREGVRGGGAWGGGERGRVVSGGGVRAGGVGGGGATRRPARDQPGRMRTATLRREAGRAASGASREEADAARMVQRCVSNGAVACEGAKPPSVECEGHARGVDGGSGLSRDAVSLQRGIGVIHGQTGFVNILFQQLPLNCCGE